METPNIKPKDSEHVLKCQVYFRNSGETPALQQTNILFRLSREMELKDFFKGVSEAEVFEIDEKGVRKKIEIANMEPLPDEMTIMPSSQVMLPSNSLNREVASNAEVNDAVGRKGEIFLWGVVTYRSANNKQQSGERLQVFS